MARYTMPLDDQCAFSGLPRPTPEYRFARNLLKGELEQVGLTKPRLWRLDWAFIEQKLAIEVEGGYAAQGRHTRASGFLGDLEKYAVLTCLGWRLLRVTPRQVKNGEALAWIQRALARDDLEADLAAWAIWQGKPRPGSEQG